MALNSEPVGQNDAALETGQKSNHQTHLDNPNVRAAFGLLAPPPAKTRHEITCKQEKTSLEKFKDWAEILGIVLLFVYTLYTIKMYRANRDAADAAKSAADTAKNSLVISQRAYLTGLYPITDYDKKIISFQILNSGHIPSSRAQVVIYEVTWNPPKPTVGETGPEYVVERHKQINNIPAVVPTSAGPSPISIAVIVPEMSKDRLLKGTQLILIVADIAYDAGFEEVKGQRSEVCIQTVYQTIAKSVFLIPCDPNKYLPGMESADWTGKTTVF